MRGGCSDVYEGGIGPMKFVVAPNLASECMQAARLQMQRHTHSRAVRLFVFEALGEATPNPA